MPTRGQRRHLLTFENPVSVPDGEGGFTTTWTELESRHAEIKPATARDLERVTASTTISSASHVMTFDYHPDVTTQTRVSWTTKGARVHTANVTGVSNPEERSIDTIVICEEVVT
jgi:head-tail adaptor